MPPVHLSHVPLTPSPTPTPRRPHPCPGLRLFLLFSCLREEAGSGLSDYGLSVAPTCGWGGWSFVGDNRLVFLTPHSVRRGTKWAEEASVEASELSFFPLRSWTSRWWGASWRCSWGPTTC